MAESELFEALNAVSGARRYREWVFRRMEPHLGRAVLDIGSGLGDFAELFARDRTRRVFMTDASEEAVAGLRRRTHGTPDLEVARLDILDAGVLKGLSGTFRADTVTCLNVLEHLEDDILALRNMRGGVVPGGKLILLVPALEGLYGSFDRFAGHYRRYTRKGLAGCLAASGWDVLNLEYFNFFGVLTWFLGGRVLRQKRIDPAACRGLDKMVPVLSFLEKFFRPPVGQSLIAIAENRQVS